MTIWQLHGGLCEMSLTWITFQIDESSRHLPTILFDAIGSFSGENQISEGRIVPHMYLLVSPYFCE